MLEFMGLQVELGIILERYNQGAVDLATNLSAGEHTHHMDVYQVFHELKEGGVLLVKWIPGTTNDADIYTENLAGIDFEKHVETYTGKDEYLSMS